MNVFLKSAYLLITVSVILSSCSGTENTNSETPKEKSSVAEIKAGNVAGYDKGEEVFKQACQACHQANGEGLPNAFPPLAKSDYLLADKIRAIKQIINGSSGEIIVNGKKFNSTMPPQNLSDDQIADVLNYVLHSWGNNGEIITAGEVKAQRGG